MDDKAMLEKILTLINEYENDEDLITTYNCIINGDIPSYEFEDLYMASNGLLQDIKNMIENKKGE